MTRAHWTVPTAAWIPVLAVEQIQSTINKKSRKGLRALPLNYSCWLLMAIGSPGLASSFVIAEDVYTHEFQPAFEQVYVMDTRADRCWRLN